MPDKFDTFINNYTQAWNDRIDRIIAGLEESNYTINTGDEVLPRLFIGGIDSLHPNYLSSNNIRFILNMATEIDLDRIPASRITHKQIHIEDGAKPPSGTFLLAARIINTAMITSAPVLVNCVGGVSRSVTAVIAYLMMFKGMSFTTALTVIRKNRPVANPNPELVIGLVRDLGSRFRI